MEQSLKEIFTFIKNNRKFSPWMREQNIDTYSKELFDEVDELKIAIKNNDIKNLKEELGDVLWDTLNLINICEDKNIFTLKDVLNESITKFKERKPHIAKGYEISRQQEIDTWHKAKKLQKEKNGK